MLHNGDAAGMPWLGAPLQGTHKGGDRMAKGAAAFRFRAENLAEEGRGPATSATDPVPAVPAAAPPRRGATRAPSRIGKKNVNFCLSEAAWEQLSILSVRSRRPIQDLMCEAADLLFQANGLSRIARE